MIVIAARKRWPMYATHEEDKLFCNAKWSDDFGNTRVIMHDNTNDMVPSSVVFIMTISSGIGNVRVQVLC